VPKSSYYERVEDGKSWHGVPGVRFRASMLFKVSPNRLHKVIDKYWKLCHVHFNIHGIIRVSHPVATICTRQAACLTCNDPRTVQTVTMKECTERNVCDEVFDQ
jgi:hypothetical protein